MYTGYREFQLYARTLFKELCVDEYGPYTTHPYPVVLCAFMREIKHGDGD